MMIDLDVPTLLKVAILVTVLQAIGWIIMGLVYRVTRQASFYYFAANVVFICSLVLGALRAETVNVLTMHIASLFSMASAMLLRLGVLRHIRQRPPWREVAGHGVIVILLATTAPIASSSLPFFAVLGAASILVSLIRLCTDLYPSMRSEFGRAPAFLVVVPFAFFALVLAFGRIPPALPEIFSPTGAPVSLVTTPRFMILTIVGVLVFNFTVLGIGIGRLVSRVRRMAERDMLTGAWNRRAFEGLLAQERARSLRTHEAFSLVMFDLDHFKRINDTLGHAAGDAALRHACTEAANVLRATDQLGRFGGEEFLVLLPATGQEGARILAERMRGILARTALRWEDADVTVTASFGVVTSSPERNDIDGLLQVVDAALYRAKAGGRNRVEAAPAR